MGETDDIEWWTDAPDPRDGVGQTVLFVTEALLAAGICLRVGAHVVATQLLTDIEEPDVDTGLQLGWAVNDHGLAKADQFAIAALWGSFICGGFLLVNATATISNPTVLLIAAANWLYASLDGAWLAVGWSLSVLR